MARVIEVISPSGAVAQRLPLADGRTRVAAQPGYKYRIADDANLPVREQVTVKRVDNDLVLEGFGNDRVVQVDGFFSRCTPDRSCSFSLEGISGSSTPVDITPKSDAVAALRDGSFVLFTPGPVEAAAAGAEVAATPAVTPPPVVESGAGGSWSPGTLALVAGGVVLAAAGLAGGGGGGGGTAVSGGTTPTPAPTPTPTPTPVPAPAGDTTAPTAPTIASVGGGAIVNAAEATAGVTVTGTAEAGSAISGTWNGGAAQTTTADATGNWRMTFAGAAIAEGQGPLSITATDAAGNTSTAATRAVSADKVAPAAPTISVISGTGADGIVNNAEATAGVVVTGQAEAGSTVTGTWNGGAEQTARVDSTGAWRMPFAGASIVEGQGSLSITDTDAAGNAGPAVTRTVTSDRTAPAVVITAAIDLSGPVESGDDTPDTTPLLIGSISEPGLSVTILRDGTVIGSTRATGTSWTFTDPGAPAGDHVYVARVTDAAGNIGRSSPFDLEIKPDIERNDASAAQSSMASLKTDPAAGIVYTLSDVPFDLDAIPGGRLDMSAGGADTLVIDASDLLLASIGGADDTAQRIRVDGDAADTVQAAGFTATSGSVAVEGRTYAVYVDSATGGAQAELLVQNTVRVVL